MSSWTKVGENLVRWHGGTIYLRAKVAGKMIRVSLKTESLRIAKIRRDERLEGMRGAAKVDAGKKAVRTLGEALEVVAARVLAQPHLKKPTIDYYKEMFDILRTTLPITVHGRSWTASEAATWWKARAKHYSPQRANNLLGMAKRVGKQLILSGLRIDDPTAGLKRVRVGNKEVVMPSRLQIEAVIEDIRNQQKAHSKQAADYVAFLAYAGCRSSQAKAFLWRHVEKDWLLFPSGVTGSKNAATRKLPISPPLREILERLKPKEGKAEGSLFTMQRPREALSNACKRLKMPHLRIHDLRHFFASFSLECGVDVPTVARWLGHKDGGALVLKTYAHIRDDHSLASAAKLGAIDAAPVILKPTGIKGTRKKRSA